MHSRCSFSQNPSISPNLCRFNNPLDKDAPTTVEYHTSPPFHTQVEPPTEWAQSKQPNTRPLRRFWSQHCHLGRDMKSQEKHREINTKREPMSPKKNLSRAPKSFTASRMMTLGKGTHDRSQKPHLLVFPRQYLSHRLFLSLSLFPDATSAL